MLPLIPRKGILNKDGSYPSGTNLAEAVRKCANWTGPIRRLDSATTAVRDAKKKAAAEAKENADALAKDPTFVASVICKDRLELAIARFQVRVDLFR